MQRRPRRTGLWWRVWCLRSQTRISFRGAVWSAGSNLNLYLHVKLVIIENLCLFFRFYLVYLSRYTELSISAPFFLPAPCAVVLLIVRVTFQMCLIIYIILISMHLYLSVKFCHNKMFQIFKIPLSIRSWYTVLRKYDHSSVWIKTYLYFLFFFLQFHCPYFYTHTSTFWLACTHVSVPLCPHLGSLPCSRLCCIFQTAAVTAAAAGLFPAGSWESYRGPDAENGSLRKEHGKLAGGSRLGEAQDSIWRAQECRGGGRGDHGLGKVWGVLCLCLKSWFCC